MVDAANPKDVQGQVPHKTPNAEGEYQGPRLHFQVPTQVSQPTTAHPAIPFGYPGAISMSTNHALQYVQTRAP